MAGVGVSGLQPLGAGQTYDRAGRVISNGVSPTFGDPTTFSDATKKQGSDYDSIMASYKDLMGSSPVGPGYTDATSAVSNLGTLANTGGYSESDIANLRARGTSPIRSIYDTARQNLDRQRSLQGGYSPGYTSALTRMTRDEANTVSNKTTDVNAGIAEAVTRNRLAASSPYASASSNLYFGDINRRLEAAGGARGLYGTTPALTNTFGNQVAEAARLGQGQQDIDIRKLGIGIPFIRG